MILEHLHVTLQLKNRRLYSLKKVDMCLNKGFILPSKQFWKLVWKIAPIHVKIKEILSYILIVCSSTLKMNSLAFLTADQNKETKNVLCFGIERMQLSHSFNNPFPSLYLENIDD